MKKYNLKKKDIISFLKVMSNFESIEFYYYSPDENKIYEDFSEIEEDTIIEIRDELYTLNKKLCEDDSIKLQEIVEDYCNKELNNLVEKIGNEEVFHMPYIVKGVGLNKNEESIKNKLKECIGFNNIIDIQLKEGANKTLRNVAPIGLYFNDVIQQYNVVITNKDGEVKELKLNNIGNIYDIYKEKNVLHLDFSIKNYLSLKRNIPMILIVFNEAKVIEKIESSFKNFMSECKKADEYNVYKIMVEDPLKYKDFINSFGRSIIVKEPIELRDTIIQETKNIIKKYRG